MFSFLRCVSEVTVKVPFSCLSLASGCPSVVFHWPLGSLALGQIALGVVVSWHFVCT